MQLELVLVLDNMQMNSIINMFCYTYDYVTMCIIKITKWIKFIGFGYGDVSIIMICSSTKELASYNYRDVFAN